MDAKSDEALFMGYALNSKAYRVFNKTSLIVEETNATPRKGVIANDDADFEDHIVEEPKEKNLSDSKEDLPLEELQRKEDQHEDLPKTWKLVKDHPIDQVIGDPVQGVRTRGALKDTCEYAAYISQLEPKNFKEAENEKKLDFGHARRVRPIRKD